MTKINAETLAEWRKDAESSIRPGDWPGYGSGPRILALLDALTAEKAAREEAERDRAMEESYCNHARDRVETLESALADMTKQAETWQETAKHAADRADKALATIARCAALADRWDHGKGDKALLGRRKSMLAIRAALDSTEEASDGR